MFLKYDDRDRAGKIQHICLLFLNMDKGWINETGIAYTQVQPPLNCQEVSARKGIEVQGTVQEVS